MNTRIVFYSWQTDLPNATNRGLIQKALENAAKAIRNDESIQIEPVVDRDTIGIPGAPDIAETILAKIERAQTFVCDVSIINKGAARPTPNSNVLIKLRYAIRTLRRSKIRPAPNPNVLIELGYAIKTLGFSKIIIVMNTAFGEPELLPFDLRQRRVVTYDMPEENEERAGARRELEAILEEGLRTILGRIEGESQTTPYQKVSLQAWNGQYVYAEGGGGGEVLANRNENKIDEWATFDLIDLKDNKIGLRAQNDDFVCAEGGGGRELIASRTKLSEWETFKLDTLGDNTVRLRAHLGQYVSVENDARGVVVARRGSPHERATFRLIQHSKTEND